MHTIGHKSTVESYECSKSWSALRLNDVLTIHHVFNYYFFELLALKVNFLQQALKEKNIKNSKDMHFKASLSLCNFNFTLWGKGDVKTSQSAYLRINCDMFSFFL